MSQTETIFRHDPDHAQRMADMLKRQALDPTLEGDNKKAEELQKRARHWDNVAKESRIGN